MIRLIPGLNGSQPISILFLGAHSDDIEIGTGGTIMRLAKETPQAHAHWVVFSARGRREEEARASAAPFLGLFQSSELSVFDFRDGYFPQCFGEIKNRFEELKPRICPDIIFTHHGNDLHQDHRLVGELTWNTFRDHLILEYEIPKYDGGLGNPNFFVTLAEAEVARKCDHLVQHFASQRESHWFSDDLFRGLMRLRGVECRSPTGYAEGFHCRKAILSWPEPRQ